MKLHTSKKWYLHLVYYQLLKFFRFFTNNLFAIKNHKFLFILSPPFCGSTVLNQLLSTSKNLSCNNHLGVREGQLLPELIDIMFYNKGWHKKVSYPWQRIKIVWMKYWDQRKLILMDKTTTNIMRVSDIKKTFKNVFFIALVRNPYAQVEGLIRRNGATVEYAAKFALMCLQYQKDNKLRDPNILFISYEDLCDNRNEIISNIKEFIPEIGMLKSDAKFSAHNFKSKGSMRIQNLNAEKIEKIDSMQLKLINDIFRKEEALLNFFGYSIIK